MAKTAKEGKQIEKNKHLKRLMEKYKTAQGGEVFLG